MSVEIALKQNILVTDFHLLKSLLVVFGFGLQAFVCGFSRQNINSGLIEKSNVIHSEFFFLKVNFGTSTHTFFRIFVWLHFLIQWPILTRWSSKKRKTGRQNILRNFCIQVNLYNIKVEFFLCNWLAHWLRLKGLKSCYNNNN